MPRTLGPAAPAASKTLWRCTKCLWDVLQAAHRPAEGERANRAPEYPRVRSTLLQGRLQGDLSQIEVLLG